MVTTQQFDCNCHVYQTLLVFDGSFKIIFISLYKHILDTLTGTDVDTHSDKGHNACFVGELL